MMNSRNQTLRSQFYQRPATAIAGNRRDSKLPSEITHAISRHNHHQNGVYYRNSSRTKPNPEADSNRKARALGTSTVSDKSNQLFPRITPKDTKISFPNNDRLRDFVLRRSNTFNGYTSKQTTNGSNSEHGRKASAFSNLTCLQLADTILSSDLYPSKYNRFPITQRQDQFDNLNNSNDKSAAGVYESPESEEEIHQQFSKHNSNCSKQDSLDRVYKRNVVIGKLGLNDILIDDIESESSSPRTYQVVFDNDDQKPSKSILKLGSVNRNSGGTLHGYLSAKSIPTKEFKLDINSIGKMRTLSRADSRPSSSSPWKLSDSQRRNVRFSVSAKVHEFAPMDPVVTKNIT